MPIYNAEKRLEKALDSIFKQTYQNFELILINDGSTDGSLQICKQYAVVHHEIVLVSIANSGPGVARNVGLDHVTGDYLAFVDADDYLEADFLENMVEVLKLSPYDIVSSNHYRVDQTREVAKNTYQTGTINKEGTAAEKKRYDLFKTASSFGYVWGKVYKTAFVTAHHLRFSEERKVFLEDTLFNLKAIAYKPNYYVLNEPLYNYNVYEGSVSNQTEDITDRALQLLENYADFLDKEAIYEENVDLFIPLTTRVIAWSLFKTMDHHFTFKNILKKVRCFSQNKTVQRVVHHKRSLKELRRLKSTAQVLLYSFMTLTIRFKTDRILALLFYVNAPLFKYYVKKTVEA